MDVKGRLKQEINKIKKEKLYRSLSLKHELVDFCSNDYLGISRLFKQGEISIKDNYEIGSGGSRLLAGNYEAILSLEKTIANVHQQEKALVYNSGYSANLGFFSCIPSKNSIILYDQKIHACVKDGMRLSLAKKTSFKHNNVEHLTEKLKKATGEIFVVVESIYSMDGDEAPLVDIASICEIYGAHLIIDEAHSTGVYGKKGSGLTSQLGLDQKVFAKIHTFGKGIGAHGACIASNYVVVDYLINKSRPFIYTTALPEHSIYVLANIYNYLENSYQELQDTIQRKIALFKKTIHHQKIKSNSPIQVVIVPGNENVRDLANKIQEKGFDVRPVLSPTVEAGQERLRICLHNFNLDEEVIQLANTINELR